MQKTGHPLREIDAFPKEHLDRLRDDLSVTTAEEFIDLARRYPESVRGVLGADDKELAVLRESAAAAAPHAEELSQEQPPEGYPFRTGHDAPPDGKETFEP